MFTSINHEILSLSFLSKNDPYPMYSSVYDPYLTNWTKDWIGCYGVDIPCERESFGMSITPFWQTANSGRTFTHEKVFLGNLCGDWNMLGLEYGPLPEGLDINNTQLGDAKVDIFSDLFLELRPSGPERCCPNPTNVIISDQSNEDYLLTDSFQNVGYFAVPIKYRKIGVRLEISVQPWEDFGLTLQGSISEIRQSVSDLIDLTGTAVSKNQVPEEFLKDIPSVDFNPKPHRCTYTFSETDSTTPYDQIQQNLMETHNAHLIFKQLGLDDCNFEETGFEDARLFAWWRHPYIINQFKDENEWPLFILIPSAQFNVVLPCGKKMNRSLLYSLPFGNDGHTSIGFDVGLAFDFIRTIEIAFLAGMMHFFPRNVSKYRLPTSSIQSGIFPFATDVKVQPGNNFNFVATMSARRFLDKLSAHVEWVFVKHETDELTLLNPDQKFNAGFVGCPLEASTITAKEAFLVEDAECCTKFVSQFVNAALNYDISPNMTLGLMAQFPVAQRNAYRSTTFLGTFRVTF